MLFPLVVTHQHLARDVQYRTRLSLGAGTLPGILRTMYPGHPRETR
jgi:hypothetical protein